MLFVVRRINDGDRFQLVGPCYLHSMMHGKVIQLEKDGKLRSEDIYLV
jgi:hypothetical protein